MNEKYSSEYYSRTELVIGQAALEKLKNSRIAVFGAGGVGGAVIEALSRVGVGSLDIIDCDEFTESNLNRQILAVCETLGQRKVEAAKARIHAVNPDCTVKTHDIFVTPENINNFDFADYDYVIDAVDNVSAKLAIIQKCGETGIPIVSCMGTGNKLDPTRFKISDIYKTSVCPLARVIRRELRERGIQKLDVLWSDEVPAVSCSPPGSVSFVPPVAGMVIAGYAIKKIIEN